MKFIVLSVIIIIIVFLVCIYISCLKAKKEKDSVNYEIKNLEAQIDVCNYIIEGIKSIKANDFTSLLYYHKHAWVNGIAVKTLGYSTNGRFREDIINLQLSDIYLGNDLAKCSLEEWIHSDACMPDSYIKCKDYLFNHYKSILVGSVGAYKQTTIDQITQLKEELYEKNHCRC